MKAARGLGSGPLGPLGSPGGSESGGTAAALSKLCEAAELLRGDKPEKAVRLWRDVQELLGELCAGIGKKATFSAAWQTPHSDTTDEAAAVTPHSAAPRAPPPHSAALRTPHSVASSTPHSAAVPPPSALKSRRVNGPAAAEKKRQYKRSREARVRRTRERAARRTPSVEASASVTVAAVGSGGAANAADINVGRWGDAPWRDADARGPAVAVVAGGAGVAAALGVVAATRVQTVWRGALVRRRAELARRSFAALLQAISKFYFLDVFD